MNPREPRSSGTWLKGLGIVLLAAGGLLYYAFGGADGGDPRAFVGVPVMIGGLLLHFRGRQHTARARAAGPASPINDERPDVLYLRAFRADTSSAFKVLASGLTSDEEQLADVLRPFGDMIAIGRPGEALPTPGAARMYASDSEWKSLVLDRMQSAPLVVIRAGTGAGLLWEFGQAVSTLDPERVLIFIFDLKKSEYTAFADRVRGAFQITLPPIGTFGAMRAMINLRENPSKVLPGFVGFSADWSPEFLPLPSTFVRLGYNDFKKSFSVALRPVFERHGVAWQPARRLG